MIYNCCKVEGMETNARLVEGENLVFSYDSTEVLHSMLAVQGKTIVYSSHVPDVVEKSLQPGFDYSPG